MTPWSWHSRRSCRNSSHSNIGVVCPFRVTHPPRKGKQFMAKRENGSGTIRRVKGAHGTVYYAYAPAVYTEHADGRVTCEREALGKFLRVSDAKSALNEFSKRPTKKFNYTLEDVHRDWKAEAYADIGKATQDNYNACWMQICAAAPALVKKQFREIVTSDMRAVMDFWMEQHEIQVPDKYGNKKTKKAGPLSLSSMTKIKSLLNQLYKYAISNKITDINYAALVKIPRGAEAGTIRAFTDAEFKILETNWRNVVGGDAVYALCFLGFRVSEFCQLSPASYNNEQKTLKGGLKTEAGKDRTVPVHPKILPLIEGWVSAGREALYADKNGRPYNKDRFTRNVWNPAIAALGLPGDLSPHSARHTCATRLAAAGARPEDIQEILGHADYSETANTYINQDVSALHKAMALMD